MLLKRFLPLYLAVLGALLLWTAWPVSPFTLLIFVAWVPLLWIESQLTSVKKFFGLAYLHMFLWNILTTWWIWYASEPGALGAFFANSLIMCIPWLLFHMTKKRWGTWIGYSSLIIYWIAFEYLHHNWELSWPWLTLGNSFATHPEWVQWYEFSGTAGGSIWVLLSNILVFAALYEFKKNGRSRAYTYSIAGWMAVIIIPLVSSFLLLQSERKKSQAELSKADDNVVVVQPNINPYTEKFSTDIISQVEKLILWSEKQMDDYTTLVVWPETAIPAQAWESDIKQTEFYNLIWNFLRRHPRANLLTGMDSYKNYGSDKSKATPTARFDAAMGTYYDAFNTAAFMAVDSSIQLYHKAKLVPGAESLPSFLNFMSSWFEHFGGMSGTLGRESEQKVFVPWDQHFKPAPIICYESIYGDYVAGFVRRGATILTVITNDGWWKNTPGYKQHMNYARLRAIETRKWVARSANTGISCFIDPLGNVIDPQAWDTTASIKLAIPVNTRETFFVKHGDILSPAFTVIALALILGNFLAWFWLKIFRKKFPALQS
ncbi:MAG: apolipoprotein N-acyltransferase [Chitinophagaceae bacterium]|nr:apolipoprotein N-acyltransferase [Chitinophagaceae bacterium]